MGAIQVSDESLLRLIRYDDGTQDPAADKTMAHLRLDFQDLAPFGVFELRMLSNSLLHGCQDTFPGLRTAIAEVRGHTKFVVLDRGAWYTLQPAQVQLMSVSSSRHYTSRCMMSIMFEVQGPCQTCHALFLAKQACTGEASDITGMLQHISMLLTHLKRRTSRSCCNHKPAKHAAICPH